VICAAVSDQRWVVREIKGDAFCLARDAGVPWRANEPVDERTCRHFPGERVLAPAGAEEEYVHGRLGIARLTGGGWCSMGQRERKRFANGLETLENG
jgi:hypothetical protein